MKVMGIINCTPDSFSDGGQCLDPAKGLQQAAEFFAAGVSFVDIGGQSTRPGAVPVSADEEWERILPLLVLLDEKFGRAAMRKVSVDSFYPEVWVRAVQSFGVGMINSVVGAKSSQRRDLETIFKIDKDLSFVAMHMHGSPVDMQDVPFDDFAATLEELGSYKQNLEQAGCKKENIWLDPGIGFGKTDRLNFCLISEASELASHSNVLYGVSRKSFIGRWLGIEKPQDRDHASKGLELGLAAAGVGMVRTHAPQALCAAGGFVL